MDPIEHFWTGKVFVTTQNNRPIEFCFIMTFYFSYLQINISFIYTVQLYIFCLEYTPLWQATKIIILYKLYTIVKNSKDQILVGLSKSIFDNTLTTALKQDKVNYFKLQLQTVTTF